MWRLASVFFLSLCAATAEAAIMGKPVEYKSNGTVHRGYLVYDTAVTARRPGVLVVHEWWGHDEHARNSAHKLAQAGYVALALDMYGDGKLAHHPDQAGKFAGEVRQNLPLMKKRFEAGLKLLRQQSQVDPKRIAAIGYCFGGTVVLEMARAGKDLRGVAVFHGSLGTERPAKPGSVKTRILVLNGAADPFVPATQVEAFKQEMDRAKVNYRLVNFPGAKHAFTNPKADEKAAKFNMPLAYDAKADAESWDELLAFLRDVFR